MSSASGSNPQLAVFLSYAREDAVATRRLAESLRGGGIEVWFDENELRGGAAWDRAIRLQMRDCALFVPVISANTQARLEGYFRLEWKLAEDRSHLMAKGKPFILPVCIDDTQERDALVPDGFLAVHWTRLAGVESTATASFASWTKELLTTGSSPSAARARSQGLGVGAASPSGNARAAMRPDSNPRIPDYELIRKIGAGGYGEVWLARGLTGAYRAVKIVWRDRFPDAAPFEREFRGLREFTAMSSEANQLALLHVGQDERAGFFYYVMELADDVASGRMIDPERYVPLTAKELKVRRKRLPAAECVTFGLELTRSLAGLHARGLLHRDIKPSNVIVVNGVPKLADIGLVASSGDARTFVGTEGFVPPEGPGTPAADVFALGKVLYELATGRDRAEFPNLPEDLGEPRERKALFALNDVILRACEPHADKRYRDAAALLADLEALRGGRPVRRIARWQVAAAAIVTIGLAGGAAWKWWPRNAPAQNPEITVAAAAVIPVPEEKTLAVLAFSNLSGDNANDYFADGVSEELLNAVAKIRGLRVSARTSAFSFKGSKATVAEIARQLGVAYVLEGNVRRMGDRVRIAVKLIKTADSFSVWSDEFDRDVKDVFALQDEVAGRVAASLQVKFVGRPVPAVVNPEAFSLYLQGRQAWNVRTAQALARAEELFNGALVLDPQFARAHAGLADVALLKAQVGRRIDLFANRNSPGLAAVRALAEKALAFDRDLAEAHTSLGGARMFGWDFAGAQRGLRLAIAQNPSYATAHQWLGRALAADGRMGEALLELKLAAELDPLSGRILDNYANTLRLAGRLTEALAIVDRSLAINPRSSQATTSRSSCCSIWAATRRRGRSWPASESGTRNTPLSRRPFSSASACGPRRKPG